MISQLSEAINTKSISTYRIIEDRYLTLERWLKIKCKESSCILSEEILAIIKALGEEPIEETMEVKPNECE